MAKLIDLAGRRFGHILVLERAGRTSYRQTAWRCKCDCGKEFVTTSQPLRAGLSTTCGCSHYEVRNLSGMRFGRLVAQEYVGRQGRRSLWRCICDCGNGKTVPLTSLVGSLNAGNLRGGTRSCGCLQPEVTRERQLKHGESPSGEFCGTAEYRTWLGMKARCVPGHPIHGDRYANRGITVCDRWRDDFAAFLADMGRRPSSKHSLDRIDNNGNYEPDNCRWATAKQQARNKSDTHLIRVGETMMPLIDVAERFSIKPGTLMGRLKKGMSLDDAVSTPVRPRRQRPSPVALPPHPVGGALSDDSGSWLW